MGGRGPTLSPSTLREDLRGVVCQCRNQGLRLATEAPEVVVPVDCCTPVVLVDRVLDLAENLAVPLQPTEVVTVEPHPQEVLRPKEEHEALRALVVREERHSVEV